MSSSWWGSGPRYNQLSEDQLKFYQKNETMINNSLREIHSSDPNNDRDEQSRKCVSLLLSLFSIM